MCRYLFENISFVRLSYVSSFAYPDVIILDILTLKGIGHKVQYCLVLYKIIITVNRKFKFLISIQFCFNKFLLSYFNSAGQKLRTIEKKIRYGCLKGRL